MWTWIDCPGINRTHILPNLTALSSLTKEELNSLNSALLTFDHLDSSCVKPHLRSLWPFYALFYSLVAFSGALGSVYMIFTIITETSGRRFINFLLFNLCLSDLFKCIIVLPLSLFVLSLAHWRLGSWLCYTSPLLQTLPVVVTMLTYVFIAFERYFLVFRPSRNWAGPGATGRVLNLAVLCGVWISSVCLILPLKTSIRYYDLAIYFGSSMDGYGFCAISFDANTKEINCALFVVLFAIPLAFITYLMTKTNQELNIRLRSEEDTNSDHQPAQNNQNDETIRDQVQRALSTPETNRLAALSIRPQRQRHSDQLGTVSSERRGNEESRRSFLSYIDHERTQLTLLLRVNRCICTMLALFALFWTPLECVMLICYIIPETPETSNTVDVLFLIFTLMGLTSSVANPALLLYQKKSVHVVLNTGIRLLRRLSSIDSRRRRSQSEDDISEHNV